ncbi:1-acyl-sn-glycerol-3-phosphate acyltransferase [Aurantivibrio plasticivorans]
MSDHNNNFCQHIPDTMPRMYWPVLDRLFGYVFKKMGWSFEGEIPKVKKAIVILAPHTSNWDFFIAMLAKFSLQLKASYIMKQEAFFWPFKSLLMTVGGIPVDRSQPARVVNQVARKIAEEDSIWVVITPEGTRKKVTKFKTGFVRIARTAGVPILVIGFDYSRKKIIFSKVVEPGEDYEEEAQSLYQYCRESFVGCRPEHQ